MKYPNILSVAEVRTNADINQIEAFPGKWVPARPSGYPSFKNRIRATWLVFTGKADALQWIKQ